MAKLEYFAVAESVAVDQSTNKVSILEILEQVPLNPDGPNAIPKCVACSLWRMDAEDTGLDFQVLLRVHRPGEESPHEGTANFTAHSDRHRVFHHMIGLPLGAAGELRFEVLLNGSHAAEHIVSVLAESTPSE